MRQLRWSFSRGVRGSRVLSSVVLVTAALALAGTAAASTAVPTRIPFTFAATNPCTGEPFSGTGLLHILVSSNASGGGMAQSHLEANLEGLQAVTLTGGKYVVPSSFDQTFVLDTSDLAPFVATLEMDELFVRLGEDGSFVMGDDFHFHFLAHDTVNGNGTVTVNDFTMTTRCQ